MNLEQKFYVFAAVCAFTYLLMVWFLECSERRHRRNRQHPIFKQDEQENWK